MTPSASQIVYRLMPKRGDNPDAAEHSKVDYFDCWVCGARAAHGMPREKWMGASFVGQNRVRAPSSDTVCDACVVVMAGKPPDTLRMYTVLVEGDRMLKLNKSNKPEMRAFLRAEHHAPWLAAIADSGKKHVIPWTPVNPPGRRGEVMFEETRVRLPDADRGWQMLDQMTALLTAAATKGEIETGDYSARAWLAARAEIDDFERRFGGARYSPWFTLALWLAQRDEAVVQARMAKEKEERDAQRKRQRDVANTHRRSAARSARGVPADAGGQRAQTLGSDPAARADGSAHKRERRRVGHVALPSAQAAGTQLDLLGGGDGADRPAARPRNRKRVARPARQ